MARREERTQEHELRKRSRAWATSSIVSSNPLSPYPPLLPNPYHPIAPDTKHLPPYTPMMPNPYPRITVDTKPPIKCTYFSNVEHHLQALACVEVLGAVEVRAQHVDQGPATHLDTRWCCGIPGTQVLSRIGMVALRRNIVVEILNIVIYI